MTTEDKVRETVRRVLEDLGAADASGKKSVQGVSVEKPSVTGASEGSRGRVALGADHGGYALKEKLVVFVRELGYLVEDCGTWSADSVDYPDFAHAVARRVAEGRADWGIVVDGAGIGSSMTANKVPGVRASLCYDLSSAKNAREHNHANVLTLGSGLLGEGLARQIVETWLETPWGPDRHARRVAKIDEIEARYTKTPGS